MGKKARREGSSLRVPGRSASRPFYKHGMDKVMLLSSVNALRDACATCAGMWPS